MASDGLPDTSRRHRNRPTSPRAPTRAARRGHGRGWRRPRAAGAPKTPICRLPQPASSLRIRLARAQRIRDDRMAVVGCDQLDGGQSSGPLFGNRQWRGSPTGCTLFDDEPRPVMIMTSVEADRVIVRPQRGVGFAIGDYAEFALVLVTVRTDTGLTGFGEAIARRGAEMTA